MYFPPWSLQELLQANDLLGLGIDPDEVRKRFETFGGSARWCLHEDSYEVQYDGIRALKMKAKQINSLAKLSACLDDLKETKKDIPHSVFHYRPIELDIPPFARRYEIVFASPQVERWIEQAICDYDAQHLGELLQLFAATPKQYASLVGFLFENYAARTLRAGGLYTLRRLTESAAPDAIKLETRRFQAIEKRNAMSIDGYLHDTDRNALYLFQTTIGDSHEVKAEGIVKLLDEFKIPIPASDLTIYFVFVVCKSMSWFPAQTISFHDNSAKLDAPVSAMKGIAGAKTSKLAADGIVTVGDLINKMQTCSVLRGKYERIVREFLVEVPADIRVFVCGLPQYLIELDIDFKSMFKEKN